MRVRFQERNDGDGFLQIVNDKGQTISFAVSVEAPEDMCFGRNLPLPEDVAKFFGVELEIVDG